ncbi:MAG: transposase [Steroidobacteraceae bacterium]|jgi:transposase|nr:transposase [Steroidobacteraceae bacterium]
MSERRSRRQYSDEYKSEAVRLANDSGKPITQVARELGVNANVLHRWMREERKAGAAGKTRSAVKAEQEEIVRLRRELARVTQRVVERIGERSGASESTVARADSGGSSALASLLWQPQDHTRSAR